LESLSRDHASKDNVITGIQNNISAGSNNASPVANGRTSYSSSSIVIIILGETYHWYPADPTPTSQAAHDDGVGVVVLPWSPWPKQAL
jgi:hypothetical protein